MRRRCLTVIRRSPVSVDLKADDEELLKKHRRLCTGRQTIEFSVDNVYRISHQARHDEWLRVAAVVDKGRLELLRQSADPSTGIAHA